MNLDKYAYIACICEGGAEQAIMELLLEDNKLIFDYNNLLDEKIIRCRSCKKFQEEYLKMDFQGKIAILRILDSRRENFKLSPLYKEKVEVINIITAPEIEMLVIINENSFKQYSKSALKPSEFCKIILKLHKIKNYKFVKEYFSNTNQLVKCVKEYNRIKKANKEYNLSDLLK